MCKSKKVQNQNTDCEAIKVDVVEEHGDDEGDCDEDGNYWLPM